MMGMGISLLSLEDYLQQVTSRDLQSQSETLRQSSGALGAAEGQLLYSPTLSASGRFESSEKQNAQGVFVFDSARIWAGNAKVEQLLPSGTTFGLGVTTEAYDFKGLPAGQPQSLTDTAFYLETRQPLWANGFGESIRAKRQFLSSVARTLELNAARALTARRIEAKRAYFELAYLTELVAVRRRAETDAEALLAWSDAKARDNLIDRSDSLQAKANLQLRRLDLKRASEALVQSRKKFELLRGAVEIPSEDLKLQRLSEINSQLPERLHFSIDAVAKRESLSAAEAEARMAQSEARPRLDLVGGAEVSALKSSTNTSLRRALGAEDLSYKIGLEFSMPLNWAARSRMVSAKELAARAALLESEQVSKDDDVKKKILFEEFNMIAEQVQLVRELEQTQKQKLEREKTRYRQGRATTFQLLSFEQDLADAQAQRLQLEFEWHQLATEADRFTERL